MKPKKTKKAAAEPKATGRSNPTKTPRQNGQSSAVIELVPAIVKLKTVLVPVDFSKFSYKAVRYAAHMAEQFGARVKLVHVVEPKLYPLDFFVVPPEMEDANIRLTRAARDRLQAIASELQGKYGVPADPVLLHGDPLTEITRYANSANADLIIIATHGYTGLKHVYLGSVAEKIVRHAPCPVLVVREREKDFI